VQAQDVLPVRSRVSFSAIFAGAVVALALSLLLHMLGAALGLSLINHVGDNTLSTGALVWAIGMTLIALFAGGYVTSRCSVGETHGEAAIYGVIMWGVVFAMLLWLMASGARMGLTAIMGVANNPAVARSDADLTASGFTEDQIANNRTQFDKLRARWDNVPAELRSAAEDPRARSAAWWTFAGVLLSMLASIAGAVVGAGPEFVLTRWGLGVRRTTTTTSSTAAPR